jgi:hypothetical protein
MYKHALLLVQEKAMVFCFCNMPNAWQEKWGRKLLSDTLMLTT